MPADPNDIMKNIPQEAAFEEGKTLADYVNVFLKRKEIIVTFFIMAVVLSAIYYYKLPNVYRATAQIMIGRDASIVNSPEVAAAGMQGSSYDRSYYDYLGTQFLIIKSRPILQMLAEQLELAKKYDSFATGDAR